MESKYLSFSTPFPGYYIVQSSVMKIYNKIIILFLLVTRKVLTRKNNVCKTFPDYNYLDRSNNCWYNPDAEDDLVSENSDTGRIFTDFIQYTDDDCQTEWL